MIPPDLLDTIDRNREALQDLVDQDPYVIIPVFPSDPPDDEDFVVTNMILIRRRYVNLAPWAIREFRYVANIFVWEQEPELPLITGEWRRWYRRSVLLDELVPPYREFL